MSESDRERALSRLIQEFRTLKKSEDGELVHKRRQMLLSIWGDLVLARNEPTQLDQPASALIDETSPDQFAQDESTTLEYDPLVVADGNHVDHDNLTLAHHAEVDDETSIVTDEHVTETLIRVDDSNSAAQEPLLVNEKLSTESHGQDHDITVTVKGGDDGHFTTPVPVDDHAEPLSFHVIKYTPQIQAETLEFQTHSEEILPQNYNPLVITAIDEKADANFVIKDIYRDDTNSSSLLVHHPDASEVPATTLVQISDVKSDELQPLLTIQESVHIKHEKIDRKSNNPGIIEEHMPDMVRLRLLKTGILHDMVLPQGTIISTNSADAEELISSGTAESLLIQSEPAD